MSDGDDTIIRRYSVCMIDEQCEYPTGRNLLNLIEWFTE